MKKKISRIMGLSVALVLVASMLVFAIPVSAEPYPDLTPAPVENAWVGFAPTGTGGAAIYGIGGMSTYFYDPNIIKVGPITEALDGDLYAAVQYAVAPYGHPATSYCDIVMSSDGGRTWSSSSDPGAYYKVDENDDITATQYAGKVVDMVASSLYEDVAYATDGNYVFKTVDGGKNWSIVAMDSLETVILGACGTTHTIGCTVSPTPDYHLGHVITSIDVGYTSSEDPIVFIGARWTNGNATTDDYDGEPEVLYINEAGYTSGWSSLGLHCFHAGAGLNGGYVPLSIGVAPNFETSKKIYVAVTRQASDLETGDGPHTWVVQNTGTYCSWTGVADLWWNCVSTNFFGSHFASRFAFSEGYATNGLMFIGVTAGTNASWSTTLREFTNTNAPGGDVYRVQDVPATEAIDLNVSGYTSGCAGYHSNICGLDIKAGDALIAGAYDIYYGAVPQDVTQVYYSEDAGWTWSGSKKDPTGGWAYSLGLTYVLWYGDTALAGTFGGYYDSQCALSMSCGTTVGEYWNQISLISMDIDYTLDLSHAPGYLDGSTTMYVLTFDDNGEGAVPWLYNNSYFTYDVTSLLRWDGTNWERVYSSCMHEYVVSGDSGAIGSYSTNLMDWVTVSPDFNETGCLYLANTGAIFFRSMDEGCSWKMLTYPCSVRPLITAWTVVDSETVLAGGGSSTYAGYSGNYAGWIYKTVYHGAQPWTKAKVPSAGPAPASASSGVDFDLSPNIAEDNSVLYGDMSGKVYVSKDLGDSWAEVQNADHSSFNAGQYNTYVQFDPGYGTSGDAGENMTYAAAGLKVGRYDLAAGGNWTYIKTLDCEASGIDAAGDTALYVAQKGGGSSATAYTLTGTMEVDYASDFCDLILDGSTVTSINGWPCTEALDIIQYNLKINEMVITFIDDGTATVTAGINGATFTYTTTGLVNGASASPVTLAAAGTFVFTATDAGTVDIVVSAGSLNLPPTGTTFTVTAYYINGTIVIQGVDTDYTARVTIHELSCTVPLPSEGLGDNAVVLVVSGDLTLTCTATTACSPGVWRCLNPMAYVKGSVNLTEWDFLTDFTYKGAAVTPVLEHCDYTAPNFNTYWTDDLWLTEGSNMLWVLDSAHPTYIWMWDDTLATRVIGTECTAGVDSLTLSWDALDDATLYEISLYKFCPACPDEKEAVYYVAATKTNWTSADICITITGLDAGTEYYWQVRVSNLDSPYILSKWSEEQTCTTGLTSTFGCSPECGEEDISLTPNFSWQPAVPGATGYEIEVATDEAFTNIIATGTPTINAWDGVPELAYGTTYYWRVRAVKDGVTSAWYNCLFSTMDEPVTPTTTTTTLEVTQEEITPMWIWVIIGIGAALVIAVIVLIVTTRRTA